MSEHNATELRRSRRGVRERYGSVREVSREGVGTHWRSYSHPPTGTDGGSTELNTHQGRQRVLSEGYDQPSQRPRGSVPPFDSADDTQNSHAPPPPTFHLIHPSISTSGGDPSQYPPRGPDSHLHHPHGSVSDRKGTSRFSGEGGILRTELIDRRDGTLSRPADDEPADAVYIVPRSVREKSEGRPPKTRRTRMGPGGAIGASSPLLNLCQQRVKN